MKIKNDVLNPEYSFDIKDFYSPEEIKQFLDVCKASKEEQYKYISSEEILSDWIFHQWDDLFCGGNTPTIEEVQQQFDDFRNWFLGL